MTPDNKKLYALCVDSSSLYIMNAASPAKDKYPKSVSLPFRPSGSVAFAPDGQHAYVVGGGNSARVAIIDTATYSFKTIALPQGGAQEIVVARK